MWEAVGNFLNGPIRTVCVHGTQALQGHFEANKDADSLSEFGS